MRINKNKNQGRISRSRSASNGMNLLKTQKDQFNKVSKTYEEENRRVSSAIFDISVTKYFQRLRGSRVLDVGNGGLRPSTILGEEIAASLTSFVAVDKNEEMLHRSKDEDDYVKIVADGANLPFEDKSFDYVLLNGVLHHLGLESSEDQYLKFEKFFKELARVCSKEIIVVEIFLPEHLERLERVAVKLLGSMPTFVLAESTLDSFLLRMGLRKRDVLSKKLSDFVGPFYWYLVILEYPWFKLPAFLSPFKYVYFTIPVPSSLK